MRFPSLAQFSEPQTVLILLGWLRIFTAGLLLAVICICWFADAQIINALVNGKYIFAGAILVIVLTVFTYISRHKDFSQWQLFALLLTDIFCWYGFMLGSGGAINPGMSYLLVLLSIAALSLQARQASLLTAITVILYALMMNTPPKSHHGHMLAWHLWGMWILFLMNAMIMMVVITLLSRALRDKDKAIAHYREETVRNEQLVSMGTMAANIAHELGTPLSTISILADGLESEDRIIIQQQIDRCKTTLQQLKTMVQKADEWYVVESSELLEHWQHECLLLRPDANITWQDDIRQPLQLTYIVEQAMLALLDNAAEAASDQVNIYLYQRDQMWVFDIQHDGLKVSEDLLKILGQQTVESTKQGLGLGYYLANASIERLGGRVQISNQSKGVLTRVALPRLGPDNKNR